MTYRPCPAEGCTTLIPPRLFACSDHWRALPTELRADLRGSWRRLVDKSQDRAKVVEEHRTVRDRAIAHLNAQGDDG